MGTSISLIKNQDLNIIQSLKGLLNEEKENIPIYGVADKENNYYNLKIRKNRQKVTGVHTSEYGPAELLKGNFSVLELNDPITIIYNPMKRKVIFRSKIFEFY